MQTILLQHSHHLLAFTQSRKSIFLKDYVALPGVAKKLLYASTDSNFSLINQHNANLYYTYRKKYCGWT